MEPGTFSRFMFSSSQSAGSVYRPAAGAQQTPGGNGAVYEAGANTVGHEVRDYNADHRGQMHEFSSA